MITLPPKFQGRAAVSPEEAAEILGLKRAIFYRRIMPYVYFVSPKTGGPINPSQIWAHFKSAARSAGLGEFRLHDLRPSCVSYLKAKGWDVKHISVHLGHANTTITNNLYIHLFADALESAAADVEEYINADPVQKQGRI
jgi:integrase